MSQIDLFKHKCLGLIECHYPQNEVYNWPIKNEIPIYLLKEKAPFGKTGDILIGGGSGEMPILRISPEKAIKFFTADSLFGLGLNFNEIIETFWDPTESFFICKGFSQVGWECDCLIEIWICHHVLSFLKNKYFTEYEHLFGPEPLLEDGSICRKPITEEEKSL